MLTMNFPTLFNILSRIILKILSHINPLYLYVNLNTQIFIKLYGNFLKNCMNHVGTFLSYSWHLLHRAKIHKSPIGLIMYPQIIQILARYLKALSTIMNTQP